MAWSMLGLPQNSQESLHQFQKHLVGWEYIHSFCHWKFVGVCAVLLLPACLYRLESNQGMAIGRGLLGVPMHSLNFISKDLLYICLAKLL
jgi:hypothetical protein